MYTEPELIQLLGRVSHFRRLPPDDLRTIVTAGHIKHVDKGSVIFHEGDPCAGLFVLFEGSVHLCKLTPGGQESILGVIDPVIMFNEVAALDGGPNPTTAAAVQDCVLWNVQYESFQALMRRLPVVGFGLLRVLASRNRLLISRYEDLTCRTVIARAAKILLELSENGQKPVNRREHPNRILAARTATVPEPFSRAIRILQDEKVITCTRTSIIVDNADRLACLAHVGIEIR